MSLRKNNRIKGFAMVLGAAMLWGFTGTVAQHLLHDRQVDPGWLVTVRLLVSGILLLLFISLRGEGAQVRAVWKTPRDRWELLLLGVVGMMGVQYTFFAAIDTGNAATATLLQYLGPVLLTGWVALSMRRMPESREWAAVGFALTGTFFLVTGGSGSSLSISPAALIWGLLSAVTLAFYTVYPARLLKRWGSAPVVGWAMLIGGVALAFFCPPWAAPWSVWSVETILLILLVVVFGTLVPFFLYLDSLRFLLPSETGLLSCAEPLTAAVLAVWWLGVPFGPGEWLGALLIMGTVILLSIGGQRERVPAKSGSKPAGGF
ncbi:EamA family transporter [Kroppenstedtia eburnea]|uniref:Threonine/homoserine efflux transporter RhtA n=1 Tax=Kroppenstedtia eburnea TaxID=714067 RepID=A0A1N7IMH2_9BACL|nr:EamA family transporter [Kroppenstedtia eburnea]QKI81979.1 EamA family transporter [Kroppenstedtia eburnea]SIS38288.1 Threonine/homoserine efflux transporter RhtA [Kroppenstedtia eburnea]